MMQILRLLLTFCLVVGVTLLFCSCAPPAKEEAPTPTVEEEAPVEEAPAEEAEEAETPAEEKPAEEPAETPEAAPAPPAQ